MLYQVVGYYVIGSVQVVGLFDVGSKVKKLWGRLLRYGSMQVVGLFDVGSKP